jgi:anti-sigma B factor antagonist
MLVRLSGDVDLAVKDKVQALLDAASQQSDRVDVDLSEVDYADSTALGLLITLRKRLQERGGELRLVAPSDRVRRLLQIAGLDQVFEILT